MGVKFNRRIKLAKGVNLNIGKKGLNSVSFKVGRTTINPTRNTFSYNSKVKGLSYQGKLVDTNKDKKVVKEIGNKYNTEEKEEARKILTDGYNIIIKDTKLIAEINKCIDNYNSVIVGVSMENEEIRKNIDVVINSNDFSEWEKNDLLSKYKKLILNGERILKEAREKKEEAIKEKMEAEKRIRGVEELLNMDKEKIINAYDNMNYYWNDINNMNNINNSSDGVVGFMFCLVGIIFLCILFSL